MLLSVVPGLVIAAAAAVVAGSPLDGPNQWDALAAVSAASAQTMMPGDVAGVAVGPPVRTAAVQPSTPGPTTPPMVTVASGGAGVDSATAIGQLSAVNSALEAAAFPAYHDSNNDSGVVVNPAQADVAAAATTQAAEYDYYGIVGPRPEPTNAANVAAAATFSSLPTITQQEEHVLAAPSIVPAVVGGYEVASEQMANYRWMVSLRYGGLGGDVQGSSHVCGGQLIAPDVVLTAAHCGKCLGLLPALQVHIIFEYCIRASTWASFQRGCMFSPYVQVICMRAFTNCQVECPQPLVEAGPILPTHRPPPWLSHYSHV